MANETVLINIKIEGTENEAKINAFSASIIKLQEENKKLAETNKALAKAEGDNSAEIAKNTSQIEANKQKISEGTASRKGLIQTIQAEDNSIKALTVRNAELVKERNLINTSTEEGRRKIQAINAQLDANNSKIKENTDALGKQKINIGNYASALGGAFKAFGAFIVASGIKELVSNVIQVTAEFQKFSAVLINTLGTKSGAQDALQMITKFAAETPFSVQELTASFVKLANQGFVPTREELRKLGDVASSQGKSFDQLTEAIIDAQTGQFERLKEFGIRASKEGDNVRFTFKGVETQTKFTSEAIQQYIIGLGDLQGVSGGMAAISETLGGKISNLGDNFDSILNALGTRSKGLIGGFLDLANSALGGLNSALNDNVENLKNENFELNILVKSATSVNVSTNARKLLIDELNKKYPDFLKNLDTEKVTNQELVDRLTNVNKQFERKIALQLAEKEQTEIIKEIIQNRRDQADIEKKIQEIQTTGGNLNYTIESQLGPLRYQKNKLIKEENELQGKSIQILDDYSKAFDIFNSNEKTYFESKKEGNKITETGNELSKTELKTIQDKSDAYSNLIFQVELYNAALQKAADAKIEASKQEVKAIQDQIDKDNELANQQAVNSILNLDIQQETADELNQIDLDAIERGRKRAAQSLRFDQLTADNKLQIARATLNALQGFAKEGTDFQKTLALATIGIDTAQAISGLTRNSEQNPANAVTFGAAGALQFALGLVRILGNIAQARSIVSQFANGGIAAIGGVLNGPSHANGGIPFAVGGRVGFEAEGGEAIINKRSTAMYKPLLSQINQAGGGVPFATGGIASNEIRIASNQAIRNSVPQMVPVLVLQDFEAKQYDKNETISIAQVI